MPFSLLPHAPSIPVHLHSRLPDFHRLLAAGGDGKLKPRAEPPIGYRSVPACLSKSILNVKQKKKKTIPGENHQLSAASSRIFCSHIMQRKRQNVAGEHERTHAQTRHGDSYNYTPCMRHLWDYPARLGVIACLHRWSAHMTHPSGFTLVFNGLLSVWHRPLHIVYRVLHIVLYAVDHFPLGKG